MLQNRAAVDGVGDRLADARVGEGLSLAVESELLRSDGDRLLHGDLRVALEPPQVGGRDLGDDVHVAGLERDDARGRFRDWPVDEGVELPLLAEVVLVALEHQLQVLPPAPELVGTGSGIILHRAPDGGGDVGHHRLEGAEGIAGNDVHREVVHHVDALDGLEEIAPVVSLRGVENALEVRLHRVGIEARTVVEADVLPELEGPGHAVVSHLPGERPGRARSSCPRRIG